MKHCVRIAIGCGAIPALGLALVAGCNDSPPSNAAPPPVAVQGAPLTSPTSPGNSAKATGAPSATVSKSSDNSSQTPRGISNSEAAVANLDDSALPPVPAPDDPRDRGGIRPPGAADPVPKPANESVLTVKPIPLDPAKPVGRPDADKPEYLNVSFNELASFEYDPIEAVTELNRKGEPSATSVGKTDGPKPISSLIPEKIRELNGRKIGVQGFMIPLEVRRNEVKSFLLVRNTMVCCFGAAASFNEWVYVQLDEGKATKFVPDVLVSAYGVLDVGEDIQDGMVMSIYRLKSGEVVLKSGY